MMGGHAVDQRHLAGERLFRSLAELGLLQRADMLLHPGERHVERLRKVADAYQAAMLDAAAVPDSIAYPQASSSKYPYNADGTLDALEMTAGSSLKNPMYLFKGPARPAGDDRSTERRPACDLGEQAFEIVRVLGRRLFDLARQFREQGVDMGEAAALARRITGPIAALAESTRRLYSGDLSARVDVPASDELGVLVNSFNRMADLERVPALITAFSSISLAIAPPPTAESRTSSLGSSRASSSPIVAAPSQVARSSYWKPRAPSAATMVRHERLNAG